MRVILQVQGDNPAGNPGLICHCQATFRFCRHRQESMGRNWPLISLPAIKTTHVAPNGEPNRAAGEREGGLQNLSLSITGQSREGGDEIPNQRKKTVQLTTIAVSVSEFSIAVDKSLQT